MRPPQKVLELWAWVVTEADGGEGIPASTRLMPGVAMPLMGADETRIRLLEGEARAIAGAKRLPLKLMRFRDAEVIQTVPARGDA